MVERPIRLGTLQRILLRAEVLEENEIITDLELDKQINTVILYIEKEKG